MIKKVWAQPSGNEKNDTQNSLRGLNDDYPASTLPLSVDDLRNEEAPPMTADSADSRRISEDAVLGDFASAEAALFDPTNVGEIPRGPTSRVNGFSSASTASSAMGAVSTDFSGLGTSKSAAMSATNGFGTPSVTTLETNAYSPGDYSEAYPTYGYYHYGMTPQQMSALAMQQRAYSGYSLPLGSASPYAAMSTMGMSAYTPFRPSPATMNKGYYGSPGVAHMGSSTGAMAGWPIDSQSPQMPTHSINGPYASAGRSNYRTSTRGGRDGGAGNFGNRQPQQPQQSGKGFSGASSHGQQHVTSFGGAGYGYNSDSVW